jgi:trehalose 6-phosphate synthase/phosphatase
MRAAPHLLLLLDYDGTLVPFAPLPDLAIPDEGLRDLLRALAERPNTAVHVVSGRGRESIERWLGDLPLALHAEHGVWSRPAPGADWQPRPVPPASWRAPARALLEDFVTRTPGALIEEKSASLAWHYRLADPDVGARQADALRHRLSELLSDAPVEILSGEKVVEVRPRGAQKGLIVASVLERMAPGTLLVALGDDRTDEDLFAALPPDAVAVHVGPTPSRAGVRLADVDDVRRLLESLLA